MTTRIHRAGIVLLATLFAAACLFTMCCCSKTLSEDDFGGKWEVVTSNGSDMKELEDKGVFTIYEFGSDGKFTMTAYLPGSSFGREGTYEISGDKLLVNVEEGASGEAELSEGTSLSMDAKAIENAEITIEDGVMTAKGIGSGDVTCKKLTEEEFQALVEKSDALGPQRVEVGEEVVGDGYTFTVDSLSFEDEIYPSDTSGYYSYYPDEDDKSYLCADVTFTNDGTEYCTPCYSTSATFSVGENKYGATIETDGGPNFSSTYSIDAKDSSRIIVVASVPDSVIDAGDVELNWSFPKNGSQMNSYYSSSADNLSYLITE